jgi:hypothetical protein
MTSEVSYFPERRGRRRPPRLVPASGVTALVRRGISRRNCTALRRHATAADRTATSASRSRQRGLDGMGGPVHLQTLWVTV